MSKEKLNKESNSDVSSEEKVAKKASKKNEVKVAKEKSSEEKVEVKSSKEKVSKEINESVKKEKYFPRLRKFYDNDVINVLMDIYKYKTPMALPKLVKIIVNVGAGDAVNDKSVIDPIVEELSLISGQRAIKTFAKKSISNFHLREGMPIGARVTIRGSRMYDFLDKLNSVALPRVRDFKGLKRSSFDGRGNYTFALKEQLVFPEIDYDKVKKIRGMDITIVTTAKSDDEAYSLLKTLGFPIKEK